MEKNNMLFLHETQQDQLGLRLDKGIIDRLKVIAELYGCSVVDVVEMMIGKGLRREHFFPTEEEFYRVNECFKINGLEKNIQDIDTIVVAASIPTFKSMYMNNFWEEIPIAEYMLDKLQYLSVYQLRPISSLTYISKIINIIPGTNNKLKYKLLLSDAMPIKPIPIKNKTQAVRHPRYTHSHFLMTAKTWDDVFPSSPPKII